MSRAFVILWMIFFHIVDDYYLQGWLASAKQRSWWKENAPDKLYRYDYIWALIMHSFSWSFMIMLPIAFVSGFTINSLYLATFAANMIIHAFTDHLKANDKTINLWQDQLMHMFQIIVTVLILL